MSPDSSSAGANPALEFIKYRIEHPTKSHLIKILPSLMSALMYEAQRHAQTLAKTDDNQRLILTKCIFDLELISIFDEVLNFTENGELASLFIDALLFQSGEKPSEVSFPENYFEEGLYSKGTQELRGIFKYCKAQEYRPDRDWVGWLFGNEYSAIFTGDPRDFAYSMPIQPYALRIRATAKFIARHALTGKPPDKIDIDASLEMVKKAENLLKEFIENLPQKQT